MTKLLEFIFWFWNPKDKRDSTGKIIDDWKRRKESNALAKKIKSGEIKLPEKKGDKPRCYKVRKDGKIIVAK